MCTYTKYYNIIDNEDTRFTIKYMGSDKFLITFAPVNELHDWIVEARDFEAFMIHNLSKFCITYDDAKYYLKMVHDIIEDYELDE